MAKKREENNLDDNFFEAWFQLYRKYPLFLNHSDVTTNTTTVNTTNTIWVYSSLTCNQWIFIDPLAVYFDSLIIINVI